MPEYHQPKLERAAYLKLLRQMGQAATKKTNRPQCYLARSNYHFVDAVRNGLDADTVVGTHFVRPDKRIGEHTIRSLGFVIFNERWLDKGQCDTNGVTHSHLASLSIKVDHKAPIYEFHLTPHGEVEPFMRLWEHDSVLRRHAHDIEEATEVILGPQIQPNQQGCYPLTTQGARLLTQLLA